MAKYKMLLIILLILSVLLYVLIKAERLGHSVEIALDKRGMLSVNDTKRPDYWTLRGWANSISKQHLHFDVAFLGNSITYHGDFQAFFPDKRIINLGVSGSTLKDLLRQFDVLEASNPQKVFIMAGANDLLEKSVDEYVLDYAELLSQIQNRLPQTKIYIQSMLPMNEAAGCKRIYPDIIIVANRQIKELAEKNKLVYIDLYSQYSQNDILPRQYTNDGLHLNQNAYEIWVETIRKFI